MYAKGIVYNDSTYFLPAGNSSPMCSVSTCYEKKKIITHCLKDFCLVIKQLLQRAIFEACTVVERLQHSNAIIRIEPQRLTIWSNSCVPAVEISQRDLGRFGNGRAVISTFDKTKGLAITHHALLDRRWCGYPVSRLRCRGFGRRLHCGGLHRGRWHRVHAYNAHTDVCFEPERGTAGTYGWVPFV